MDRGFARRPRFGPGTGAVRPRPAGGPLGGAASVPTRAPAVAWAAALAADPDVLFLDTETTGLGPTAEVVDLAVVGHDGRVLLETLVRPLDPIPPDATAIHGLRDADVAIAPAWPAVHDALCRLLAGRPVVVYNAAFDRRLVAQSGARYGLVLPEVRWECAMLAYAEFRGEPGGRGGRCRWHKLEQAARAFGAAPGGHRAAADALACRAVLFGIAAAAADR